MTNISKKCILEVERKFRSLAVHHLTKTSGNPPFKSLLSLPPQKIRDTYFNDKLGLLSSSGIWIRRRNGLWQAKVSKGGNYTNSQFEELDDMNEIADCVKRVTGLGRGEEEGFGLGIMADFMTERERWMADEEFTIVRDEMDFGHVVGEVELQKEWVGDGEEGKREEMRRMDLRLKGFMKRYGWAFDMGGEKEVEGKLTAYFRIMGKSPTDF
ncbi:CYTH-like domain-containing protein [Podospora fimiseda]|uniref:Thiamine-triphosphatase n=1 Tax=Podospora fimiseda TaxID=252190 RepID=A0AAN7BZD2_9PEZI|nr:CYTH-like domain-containing protein [Podospora fimiseda]